MANEVIHMTLEEFEGGLVAPPTADDVSLTVDGRRLDSKTAVLAWWAEVANDVAAEEAARLVAPGSDDGSAIPPWSGWRYRPGVPTR